MFPKEFEKRVPDFLPIEDGDIKSALTKYSLKVNRYMFGCMLVSLIRLPADQVLEHIKEITATITEIAEDQDHLIRSGFISDVPQVFMMCHELVNPDLEYHLYDLLLDIILRHMRDSAPPVRKYAYNSLTLILEKYLLDKERIESKVCPAVLELSREKIVDSIQIDYHTGAVILMAKLAPIIGKEKTERYFLNRFLEMCTDEVYYVRRVCVANFPVFCKVLGAEFTQNVLLPKFVKLCDDTVWGVRKASAESFPMVALMCSETDRREQLTPLLAKLMSDTSRWVSMTAFKVLGQFISSFAKPCITGLSYSPTGGIVITNAADDDFKQQSETDLLENYAHYEKIFEESMAPPTNSNMDNKYDSITGLDTDADEVHSDNNSNGSESPDDSGINGWWGNDYTDQNNYIGGGRDHDERTRRKIASFIKSSTLSNGSNESRSYTSPKKFPQPPAAALRYKKQLTADVKNYVQESQSPTNSCSSISSSAALTPLSSHSPVPPYSATDNNNSSATPKYNDRNRYLIRSNGFDELSDSDALNVASEEPPLPPPPPPPIAEVPTSSTTKTTETNNCNSSNMGHLKRNVPSDLPLIIKDAINSVPPTERDRRKTMRLNISLANLAPPETPNIEDAPESMDFSLPNVARHSETTDIDKQLTEDEEIAKRLSDINFSALKPNDLDTDDDVIEPYYDSGLLDNVPSVERIDDENSIVEQSIYLLTNSRAPPPYENHGQEDSDDESFRDFNSYKYWHITPPDIVIDPLLVDESKESDRDQSAAGDFKPLMNKTPSIKNLTDDSDDRNHSSYNAYDLMDLNNDHDDIFSSSKIVIPATNDISKFQQDIVPATLIEYYAAMVQFDDPDMKYFCAFNFPAVVLTLGRENWHLLNDIMLKLCADIQWNIRKTMATSICRLAQIIGKELATRDLVSVYLAFFKDFDEVKIEALKNLTDFLKVIEPERHHEIVYNLDECLKTENANWRLREELAQQVLLLIQMYENPKNCCMKYLNYIIFSLVIDKVNSVREIAFDALVAKTKKICNEIRRNNSTASAKEMRRFVNLLLENFAKDHHWRQRQTFVNICNKLITEDAIPIEIFEEKMLDYLNVLAIDKVPNVRLTVARCLSNAIIKHEFFNRPEKNGQLTNIIDTIKLLQSDADRDVREMAQCTEVPSMYVEENVKTSYFPSDTDDDDQTLSQEPSKSQLEDSDMNISSDNSRNSSLGNNDLTASETETVEG